MVQKISLVVDDSSVVRKVSRTILEALDFKVLEAEDGKAALAICDVEMPHVILLDWNMPVMDGLSFLKAFRDREDGNKSVIIFCTTENDIKKIQTAMAAGADEYIMKPYDSDIIKTKLQQLGLY